MEIKEQIKGLRNYIKDYSMLAQREDLGYINLWEDYFIIENGQLKGFTDYGKSLNLTSLTITETFDGVVRQIRLSPTVTSNVVVYTVVIDVDNTDLRLKPGMTAFVTIIISEKQNVWKAANSAFLVRSYNGIVDDLDINGATPQTHMLLMRDDKIILIPYQKGLSTATETEIISDEIQMGDRIVTGRVGAKTMSSGQQMQMRGPMGGGPR